MPKILIIEDNQDLVLTLGESLMDEDFEVEAAHTGTDGLMKLRQQAFDAVVLDLHLPGEKLNGLEICKQIRADKNMVPILIISGEDSVMRKEQLARAGADDYLTKPFLIKDLFARLRRLLRRSADIDRIFES